MMENKETLIRKGPQIGIIAGLIIAAIPLSPLSLSIPGINKTTEKPQKERIVINAVGDIMMGSIHPVPKLPPKDGKALFDGVKHILKTGDIVMGNLEGPLTDQATPVKCKDALNPCYEFVTPTRYRSRLKEAGFNIAAISNNHASDAGLSGVEETLKALRSAGIGATGGPSIAVMEVKGKCVAIAGFSYMPGDYAYSIHDLDEAAKTIGGLKDEYDIVIVTVHAGAEGAAARHVSDAEEVFLDENRGNMISFSHAVIDAGADLVIGHGPHVLRALEVYKGKLIAYSLGNFLTYKRFNVTGPAGISAILRVELDTDNGNFQSGAIIPIQLTREGVPHVDPKNKGTILLKQLSLEDIKDNQIDINEKTGAITLK